MIPVAQAEKGQVFRDLHQRTGAFIIPNPWDRGTAKLLEHSGFEALATTSAGCAFSAGRPDGTIGREQMMAHIGALAAVTNLPISADLENGFGDDAPTVATTIRLAAAAGAVGGSIEDATGRADDPLYEIAHAADRIRAAAEVARSFDFNFVLTARAESFLVGRRDIADVIRRLQTYQEAGADVLYAPGLTTREEIEAVVRSVDRPVNVVMGLASSTLSVADLSRIGVRRISVGSALSRAALTAFLRAAREMRDNGTFTFANDAASYREINAIFELGRRAPAASVPPGKR
jgi:2-methylisocitrate lyase-like PEP mutase family enzyme